MPRSSFRLRVRTVGELRTTVFFVLVCLAIALSALPVALLRRPRAIEAVMVFDLIRRLSGLWLPALSCFAAFWFSERRDARVHRAALGGGQAAAALVLTALYGAICLFLVYLVLFVQSYDADQTTNEPIHPTVQESLSDVTAWLQLLSPVLLAPIGFLTGRTPEQSEPTGGAREQRPAESA